MADSENIGDDHHSTAYPELRIDPPSRSQTQRSTAEDPRDTLLESFSPRGRIRKDKHLLDPLRIPEEDQTKLQKPFGSLNVSNESLLDTSSARSLSPASRKFHEILQPISNTLSSRKSIDTDQERSELSFVSSLAGDDDLDLLKADIKLALGDRKGSGSWLHRKPPPLSPKKNTSKVSFNEHPEAIELQSIGPFSTKNDTNSSKDQFFEARETVEENHKDDGVFRNITTKFQNLGHANRNKFGYDEPFTPKTRPISAFGEEATLEKDDFTNEHTTSQNQPLRLYGKSLKLFDRYNGFRIFVAEALVKESYGHVMRSLILIQTCLLSYRQWNPRKLHGYVIYGFNWADWFLLAINIIYTIESCCQIVAWGFWDDSEAFEEQNIPYDSLQDRLGINRIKDYFFGSKVTEKSYLDKELKRSITFRANLSVDRPIHRAYLRKTWNRLDFISTCCYWIDMMLSISHFNARQSIPLFRALSCLRILRLTNITNRISLLLRSIKNGLPQLTDVVLFILYFWTLFAIIGTQSFKSSFRRYCVWTNPDNSSDTYITSQHCGGSYYLKSDGSVGRKAFYNHDGMLGDRSKGFLCPVNSECKTLENPYGNTYSFDNILNSMQLTFVIMSGNTFSNTMYDTMDTDSMAASIFFIFGIFFLLLWMINLLVAVISTSFRATIEAQEAESAPQTDQIDFDLNWLLPKNPYSKFYLNFKILFEVAIFAAILLQTRRDKDSSPDFLNTEYKGQSLISLVLLIEIIIRFALYFPKFKTFFRVRRNCFDLFLALVTSLIAIPSVHSGLGKGYDWLRIFQLLRFYRNVLWIPFIRRLWAQVWKNISTIFNLSLFYFMLLYLVSIIFARYFENFSPVDAINDTQFPFHTLPNVFLGLYVITSTENWTEIMYGMQQYAPNKSSIFFGAIFFILWFLLSNSIILNIFIAIIGDSLQVSEKEKRKEQVKKFVLIDFPKRLRTITEGTVLSQLRTRLFGEETQGHQDHEVQRLLLNGAAIEAFLSEELKEIQDRGETSTDESDGGAFPAVISQSLISSTKKASGYVSWIRKALKFDNNPFYKTRREGLIRDDNYLSLAEKFQVETEKRIHERKVFLEENPGFNASLYIFRPKQPLRVLCQKITKSSYGKRYDGVEPNKIAYGIYISIISISTIAIVVIAAYTTPLYRKKNFTESSYWNWTLDVEIAFGVLFLLEFLIKIVADGLIFTPNGFLRNSWNIIDLVVLISIWINIIAIIKDDEHLSRVVRGVKALRALRLLTISETSKDIFQKVMIAGVWKIFSAAFLSFTLLLPFSIWGLNLFTGTLGTCNDGSVGLSGCVNEYSNTVYNWDILMPKAYAEPQLEFNRFASSLLTLFEVLSMEGWTDLLENLVNSTGIGTPTQSYATPVNAFFMVLFIFVGIIFVLTLFVSAIITNYARLSGTGFLTLQQTSWIEAQKLLKQAKPRHRPEKHNLSKVRSICYKFSVDTSKPISVLLQILLWIHILAILLEKFPSVDALDNFRYAIYILSSTVFLIFTLMKLVAVGPYTFFKSKWNAYQLFVFVGAFATSFTSFFVSRNTIFANINKLFLVGIFTAVIHMSNRLSHLLKIASASIPSLLSLIFTWGVLFLVYAIALNQIFGLTKLGPNSTNNQNARTVTKSLLLLFKNSFGEGWNYTMRDFAIEEPYCYVKNNALSDCGNMQYAYVLFISWNVVSMYIFVNMFVSMIFESFSHVYADSHSTSSLNRDEIRKFKTVWQIYDPHATGFISPDNLHSFLRNLHGYFSFEVYDRKWNALEIKKEWIEVSETDPYDVKVNIRGLDRMLNHLDITKVKERRLAYDRFVEEAKFNMELFDEPGISFNRIILQIPLYSKFDENECLELTEFLDRLVIARKLSERLDYRHRLECLSMVVHRWRYLKRYKPQKISEFVKFKTNRISLSNYKGYETPTLSRPLDRGAIFTDEGYWSPKKASYDDDKSQMAIDEISGIAGGLKNSQWIDGIRSVQSDIDQVVGTSSSRIAEDANGRISFDSESDDEVAVGDNGHKRGSGRRIV